MITALELVKLEQYLEESKIIKEVIIDDYYKGIRIYIIAVNDKSGLDIYYGIGNNEYKKASEGKLLECITNILDKGEYGECTSDSEK